MACFLQRKLWDALYFITSLKHATFSFNRFYLVSSSRFSFMRYAISIKTLSPPPTKIAMKTMIKPTTMPTKITILTTIMCRWASRYKRLVNRLICWKRGNQQRQMQQPQKMKWMKHSLQEQAMVVHVCTSLNVFFNYSFSKQL